MNGKELSNDDVMMDGIEYDCDELEFMNEVDAMDNEVWKRKINDVKTQK